MTKKPSIVECDICIIGAGVAGLTLSAACAQLGLNTVLIEQNIQPSFTQSEHAGGVMGGAHLHYACLPRQALLASAHQAQQMRNAYLFGLSPSDTKTRMGDIWAHVLGGMERIAPNHSTARFEALGVYIVEGKARFTDAHMITVEKTSGSAQNFKAKKFIIATGSHTQVPAIRGLGDVPFYTEENLLSIAERPTHMIVVGGGANAIETAQAFRRLGSAVTIIHRKDILSDQDSEMVDILRHRLVTEGINIIEGGQVTEFVSQAGEQSWNVVRMRYSLDGREHHLDASHIYIACGRQKNTKSLDLAKADIQTDEQGGIIVNDRLQTAQKHIFALGACAALDGWRGTTHEATFQASIVIKNILFKLPAKITNKQTKQAMPYAIFTDPEFVQIGLNEAQAREKFGKDVSFARWSLNENDRAQMTHAGQGMIKIVMRKNGRILGISLVASQASEMAAFWSLAIAKKMNISEIAELPFVYPTYSELGKRAAGSFFLRKFLSPLTKKIVRFLFRLG